MTLTTLRAFNGNWSDRQHQEYRQSVDNFLAGNIAEMHKKFDEALEEETNGGFNLAGMFHWSSGEVLRAVDRNLYETILWGFVADEFYRYEKYVLRKTPMRDTLPEMFEEEE
tara:strand:- start:110 stop:445 length:336 start_codon:yes stop_codon:yes gene_type:complete